MIEHSVIVRLERMVERLNSVLEQNLLSEYSKLGIRVSKKGNAVYKLLKLEPLLRELRHARLAKDLIVSASLSESSTSAIENYLHAAAILYDILCELSASDSERVHCGVKIEPALKRALKKAMEDNSTHAAASKVFNFVTINAPAYSWSYQDRRDHNGYKIFELVDSKNYFNLLLQDDYEEITGSEMAGIRIAFKREEPHIILDVERKAKETNLKKAVGHETYDKYGSKACEILYPSLCYTSYYKIYVPTI